MTSPRTCLWALLAALLVSGCGDGLRPVGAAAVARLPKQRQRPQQQFESLEPREEQLIPKRRNLNEAEKPASPRVGGGAPEVDVQADVEAGIPVDATPIGPSNTGRAKADAASEEVEALYRRSCGPCHSLDLVEHQRLGQDDWEWVLEDMVETYGATWITPKQQERLLGYLTDKYGPDTK